MLIDAGRRHRLALTVQPRGKGLTRDIAIHISQSASSRIPVGAARPCRRGPEQAHTRVGNAIAESSANAQNTTAR
ncbi:hypothetical protein MBOT_34580 [Mycobacterium botniense]|uniref:Uncharacterized protein n=1 Tax=Mycobacterium botniense TaxID=84962 RepID=A0A7I9Y2I5_9MYCO|nr:hypothetical protein MBOT_34580 [Mycobacterium botniense]